MLIKNPLPVIATHEKGEFLCRIGSKKESGYAGRVDLTGVSWPTCISVRYEMAINKESQLCWDVSETGGRVALPYRDKSTTCLVPAMPA